MNARTTRKTADAHAPIPRSRLGKRQLAAMRRRLLIWFCQCGREFPWRAARCNTYRKAVAELLLQRTRAETVAAFLPKFFVTYPSWRAVCDAEAATLERCLRPLGLSQRRAAVLQTLAAEMVARRGRFPRDYSGLVDLPGIGQYIANALLVVGHGQRAPMLDTNMVRVLERCCGPRRLADIRYDPHLQNLSRRLVDCMPSAKINWAILDLGALICTPRNPACHACPLSAYCFYGRRVLVKPKGAGAA
jgi:A/G-specific adenine glycosylase